jgi:hypothetical protein
MVLKVLAGIFRKLRYTVIATVITVLVFTFSVWLPNFRAIQSVFSLESATLANKLNFLWSLYGSIGTNFTFISASYTIAIAILFGINIALLSYYIKTRKSLILNGSTASVGGFVSGIFGIGCASCGTFLLTSFLVAIGAGGFIFYLPLGGEEFGILGVILLGYSVYATSKKIDGPLVCED